MPSFPDEYLDYLRMRVGDLTPNEYWETSRYDYETAIAVQQAWRDGAQDARDEQEDSA